MLNRSHLTTEPDHKNRNDRAGAFYASTINQTQDQPEISWLGAEDKDFFITERDQQTLSNRRSKDSFQLSHYPSKDDPRPDWEGKGIGYKLLRKAGYKGTGGLGVREQGPEAPLQAWKQSGKQGIGALHAKPSHAENDQQDKLSVRSRAKSAPRSLRSQAQDSSNEQSSMATKDAAKLSRLRRKHPRVQVEEDIDTKVRRWKQVLQTEVDEKAGKEIDRYMFRLFKDDSALDSNPLTRYNNLSSTNPLL